MCGIAGFEVTTADAAAAAAANLLESLRSRGPDDAGKLQRRGICMVQTRLAVIDLSERVAYPMPNENEDVWLLFNGEIYDHGPLRRELEGFGHRFRTNCDAEVVVHGYEQWGADVFRRLHGMFALAILDERSGAVLLSRDRVGIKPLVRTSEGRFAFSSDAMALVSAGLSPGEVDRGAIDEFAAFHYVPHPGTGIAGIEQVEPGTVVQRAADGSVSVDRWSPRPFKGPSAERQVEAGETEAVLRAAVSRQLVADVDVGIFLSAGVDSSLILTLAAEAGAKPRTFTLGFPGHGDYDESEAAAELAAALGVPHHHARFDTSFEDALSNLSTAFDQPFADASALAALQLAREARQGATVLLTGTGGDDLFAGYYRHRAYRLRAAVAALPERLRRRLGGMSVGRGGERRSGGSLARSYLARLAAADSAGDSEQYLGLVAAMTARPAIDALQWRSDPKDAGASVAARLDLSLDERHPLRGIEAFEFATYVPGDLLVKEDRATMAVGLEARVPLLDDELVGLAERMPDRQKASLRAGKLPLRKLARRIVPTAAGRGRKRGFAVPLADLFQGAWRDQAVDWFESSDSALVDGHRAATLISGAAPLATDAWALAALTAWEQRLARCRRSAASLAGSTTARP